MHCVDGKLHGVCLMRFVLLTTSSPSTNPRLVKELRLLHAQHHVQVIAFRIGNWADVADKQWLSTVQQAQVIRLPATRKPLLPWLLGTTARYKKVFSIF